MQCQDIILDTIYGERKASICEDAKLPDYIDGMADTRKNIAYIDEDTLYPKDYVKIHEVVHLKDPTLSEYQVRLIADDYYTKTTGNPIDSAGDYMRQSLDNLFKMRLPLEEKPVRIFYIV